MKTRRLCLSAAMLPLSFCLASGAASAGEKPLTGPVPGWVSATPSVPAGSVQGGDTIVRFDEQTLVDGNTSVAFIDMEQHVATGDSLQKLGTVSVSWQPDQGDVTFHKLQIRRDGETIDLLGDGTPFAVLRREAGLESQILDGVLTATRQLQGLRLGDTVRIAYSISRHDKSLGGKAQTALVLIPEPVKLGFGQAKVVWPAAQNVQVKAMVDGLDATPRAAALGYREVTIPFPIGKFEEMPKDIPARFAPLPLLVASNFSGWDEVAATMAPLYETEGAIAEGSALAKVTDEIAATHSGPRERIAAALRIVQSDVRYLLVALGTGNYTPQDPARTWEVRYGDCKAKTLLLLAMLERMGIEAEPVLANSRLGDVVPKFLPAPQAFDHVFVHASADGRDYWLDGTSAGSRLADLDDIPAFGHVLPVRAKGGTLFSLPQRANARPSPKVAITYDQRAGAHLPAPFEMTVTYSGAEAEQMHSQLNNADRDRKMEVVEGLSDTWVDSRTVLAPRTRYDADDATYTIAFDGVAYPDWYFEDGHLQYEFIPTLRVAFNPDRGKSAWRPLPALIRNPWTAEVTITKLLPADAAGATFEKLDALSIDDAALHYARTITRDGTKLVETIRSRETSAEVPSDRIPALRRDVASLDNAVSRIVLPEDYPHRWTDVERMRNSPTLARVRAIMDARIEENPESAWALADRAWLETRLFNYEEAAALYGKAIALDPIADHYLSRARMRSMTGDSRGALADQQAAYDLDTSSEDARNALASGLALNGRIDDALALLPERSDAASEEGRAALITRAKVLLLGKQFDAMIELLDASLGRKATAPDLLDSRCWSKAMANVDLPGALSDCSRAIELSADPAAIFDSRAFVHFRNGDLDAARADAEAALAIDPEMSSTLFLLGVVNKREGRKSDAELAFAAARKLYPSIEAVYARYGIEP